MIIMFYHMMIIWWLYIYLVFKDRCVNQMIIVWLSHDYHLVIIQRQSYFYIIIIWWLSIYSVIKDQFDYHMIIIDDHQKNICLSCNYQQMVIWWLSDDHFTIIWWSFDDHLMIIWWSSIYLVIKDRRVYHIIIVW